MINLIRCDDRLIHGQCMTRIVQHYFIKEIIVVDDFTATNSIMKIVFEKAVPPTIKAHVYTFEESIDKIKEAMCSDVGTLVLFRLPTMYEKLAERIADLPKKMNIGPVPMRSGCKEVNTGTYLNSEEAASLQRMAQQGVELIFNIVPDQKKFSWDEIKKKLN